MASKPLLNPLTLSSDTTSRFGLLVLAALLLTWNVGSALVETKNPFSAVYDLSPGLQEWMDAKVERFRTTGEVKPTREDIEVIVKHQDEMRRHLSHHGDSLSRIASSFLLAGLFLVSTAGIYALLPLWLRHRFRLRDLPASEAPGVNREIERLAREMGVGTPEIAARPGLLGGLAIRGRKGPCLVLDGAPKWLEKGWNDFHRAVALHELGHIANRDIRNREIARCAWLALGLVIAAAFPLIAMRNRGDLPVASLRLGALALVIWWLWAGLVRTRELYADSRVLEAGFGDTLGRCLALPEAKDTKGVRRLWRLHPSNADRLAHLRAPERLFRISTSLAFLTGLLAGIVTGNAGTALFDFAFLAVNLSVVAAASLLVATGGLQSGLFLWLGAGSLFVVPLLALTIGSWTISASLGIQALRSAVADLDTRKASRWGYLPLARFALLFVLGIEAGFLLSPWAFSGWRLSFGMILWALLLTGAIWTWLLQTRATGRLFLGALAEHSSVRWAERFLRGFAAIQLTILAIPALVGRLTLAVASDSRKIEMLSRANHPEGEAAVMLETSAFVFSAFGIALMVASNLLLLGGLWLWLELRRSACPSCGQPREGWRAVGRRCAACGSPSAPWLHLPQPSRPGETR